MQDAHAGNGREEEDGAAGAGGDHVAGAGLGDEEGPGEVDVEEGAEHGRVIGFRFDVGASVCEQRDFEWAENESMQCMDGIRWMDGWIDA